MSPQPELLVGLEVAACFHPGLSWDLPVPLVANHQSF